MNVFSFFSKVKNRIRVEKLWYEEYKKFKEEYLNLDGENIILSCVPRHGNVGDHAIACAEIDYIKDKIEGKNLIEASGFLMSLHPKLLKSFIKDSDIFAITGGGFIGTLWMNEEKRVRNIAKTFKNNKVVILPQTIYYENSQWGQKELEKTKRIFNSHGNLSICVREKKSYDFATNNFKDKKIYLMPDMVLYLSKKEYKENKSGCLLCMRMDKEKILTDKEINDMKCILLNYFSEDSIRNTDTVTTYMINKEMSREEVNKKIEEFAKAELVITDRLHGMILATIAGTPCIAFGNSSGKVKGVYEEWISDLEYITYLDDFSNLQEDIVRVLNAKNKNYTNSKVIHHYNKLIELLN